MLWGICRPSVCSAGRGVVCGGSRYVYVYVCVSLTLTPGWAGLGWAAQDEDPRWRLADPICTFIFALLVLLTSKNIIRDIAHTLMERTPPHLDIGKIVADMSEVRGVACSGVVWHAHAGCVQNSAAMPVRGAGCGVWCTHAGDACLHVRHGVHFRRASAARQASIHGVHARGRPLTPTHSMARRAALLLACGARAYTACAPCVPCGADRRRAGHP